MTTITIRPIGAVRFRPSNAKLRKELHDAATSRKRRCQIYAFLQYRKRYTRGR